MDLRLNKTTELKQHASKNLTSEQSCHYSLWCWKHPAACNYHGDAPDGAGISYPGSSIAAPLDHVEYAERGVATVFP